MRTSTKLQSITSASLRTLIAGAILFTISASLASASAAEEGAERPQVTVRFADLDLSTSQGSVRLYSRIHAAAVEVCSRMYSIADSYRRHKDACLKTLIVDAVTKVNQPVLSAVLASNYGVSSPAVLTAAGTR